MKKVCFLYFSIIILMATGCPNIWQVRGYNCSQFSNIYFGMSYDERLAEIEDYDLEKKYAVYICGTQYIHPPIFYLAEPLAKEGERAVSFLKERLIEANSDYTVLDILRVFAEMNRLKTYHVSQDKVFIRSIEEVVATITDQALKEMSEHYLKKIKGY
jgi:hypothetical protein